MYKYQTVEEFQTRINELKNFLKTYKGTECSVWARIVGYFRPTHAYNPGKAKEYTDRVMFNVDDILKKDYNPALAKKPEK